MILTCLHCTRQHDYPNGWPARAALPCWDCGALHLAEQANTVRLATPTELEGFAKVQAYRDQQRVMEWVKQLFAGREGMVPADEIVSAASRAARALGIEVGTTGVTGVAAINGDTGDGFEVASAQGGDDCLHCMIVQMVAARARVNPNHNAADDVIKILRAAAHLIAIQRADPDPASDDELIARSCRSLVSNLLKAIEVEREARGGGGGAVSLTVPANTAI